MFHTLLLLSTLTAAPGPAPAAVAAPAAPAIAHGDTRRTVVTIKHKAHEAEAEHEREHEQDRRDGRGTTVDGERVVQKFNVGADGALRVSNVAGDVIVTGGSGADIMVEAVKRGRGRNDSEARSQLANVDIDINKVGSRVEIETTHRRNSRAWVDYKIMVPVGTSVELRSVSGDVRVNNVKGEVRAESVSGDVTAGSLARVASLKSVSGDVEATGLNAEAELAAASVSGNVVLADLKARTVRVETVSGDVALKGCTCGQANAQSVSGTLTFSGTLDRNGRYSFNTHSGDVHLGTGGSGFELNASTFSGSIRSETPMTTRSGGDRDRRGRSIKTTVGSGGAYVEVTTFSGDIIVTK